MRNLRDELNVLKAQLNSTILPSFNKTSKLKRIHENESAFQVLTSMANNMKHASEKNDIALFDRSKACYLSAFKHINNVVAQEFYHVFLGHFLDRGYTSAAPMAAAIFIWNKEQKFKLWLRSISLWMYDTPIIFVSHGRYAPQDKYYFTLDEWNLMGANIDRLYHHAINRNQLRLFNERELYGKESRKPRYKSIPIKPSTKRLL